MQRSVHSGLYHRISRLRWQAPVLAFALVLLHQYVEHKWLFFLPKWQHFWTQVFFYGLIGPALAWWALTSLRRQVVETEEAERALRKSKEALERANERLEFLIKVDRRLAEAQDEEALVEKMLELPEQVLPALGCSLVRFDEEQQPLPAVHRGELDPESFEVWAAHLSSPVARQACQACESHWASDATACPLLIEGRRHLQVRKVHCLPLERAGRAFGVLNIYLGEEDRPTSEERVLLEIMANGMSLALESHHLRSRELAAFYRLQEITRLEALEDQLAEVLESTVQALEVDGGALFLRKEADDRLELVGLAGTTPEPPMDMLKALAGSVQSEVSALTVHDLDQLREPETSLRSISVAPLRMEAKWLGSLLAWARRANAFSRRQTRVLEAVASQMSLLVENHRLYRQAEYEAGVAERSRLAREIHDGLAQSLGYLKLRTSQIVAWMRDGFTERAGQGLAEVQRLIDEAYLDAREAIDGLRIDPGEGKLEEWLNLAYQEFEKLAGIQIEATPGPNLALPSEVQAQLLRILQEALGNVRKHANANLATVEWTKDVHWLVLRVGDDGQGFDPSDVPPISRHGLRIMRERAELLSADFQVISRKGEGTQVVVRLPLGEVSRESNEG